MSRTDRFAEVDRLAGTNQSLWASRFRWLNHQQPLLMLVVVAVLGIIIDDYCCRLTNQALSECVLVGWIAMSAASLIALFAPARFKLTMLGHWWEPIAIAVLVMSIAGINHRRQDRVYESASVLSMIDSQPRPAIIEGTLSSTPSKGTQSIALANDSPDRCSAVSSWPEL